MRTKNEYDRFPIAKRGYDPQSVEAFIELAAADNDRMLNEAAARIASLESELEEAKRQEEAVHLTIQAATKTRDDIIAAARHQAGEMVANGRKEGDRIVTEARMQAFQLVTGARKEAETVVGEARVEAAAVTRADESVETSFGGPTEREEALLQRIDETNRVISDMQQVIAAMEEELATRPPAAEFEAALAAAKAAEERALAAAKKAEAAPSEVADEAADEVVDEVNDNVEDQPAAEAEPEAAPPSADAEEDREEASEELPEDVAEDVAEDDSDDIDIVVNDTPSAERADDNTEIAVDDVAITVEGSESPQPAATEADPRITDERTPEGVRRSFYSRRSARLPRIGAEGGRDTMAAIAGLRTHIAASEGGADADSKDTPAFEAV